MRRQTTVSLGTTVAFGLAFVVAGCQDEPDPFAAAAGPTGDYVSQPEIGAPEIEVETFGPAGERAMAGDDLVFLAPKDGEPMDGPLIVTAEGEPVWIGPDGRAYDFRAQEYEGEPVLTWWRGENLGVGYGAGEYVIVDSSYEEIATVTTSNTQRADFHGMTLTDDGTALLISYPEVRRDLTAIGGPEDGYLLDGVVQEVDVETGEVLFEWSALDHVPLTETRVDILTAEDQDGGPDTPFDYVHLNSVAEDGADGLLISARNTSTVYRIDRQTGEIDWKLGGSDSDFAMGAGTTFAWQHDAQRHPDGTITLFDNEAAPPVDHQSRGLRLELDPRAGTARVVTEYLPPDGRLADSQGNLQQLPNGHVLIGWGAQTFHTEYTADGRLLFDAELTSGETYRVFRFPWEGEPTEPPSLAVADGTAYATWNGATEVAAWRFLAGESAEEATEVATVPREEFETSVEVLDAAYVAVEALDESGQVLATAES